MFAFSGLWILEPGIWSVMASATVGQAFAGSILDTHALFLQAMNRFANLRGSHKFGVPYSWFLK